MQLKYTEDFINIIPEITTYWQDKNELPTSVINFIKESLKKCYYYNFKEKKQYCLKCNQAIKKGICPKCRRKYDLYEIYENYNYNSDNTISNRFYYFDINKEYVILYEIKGTISYINHKSNIEIEIIHAYNMTHDTIQELIENKCYSYAYLEKEYIQTDNYSWYNQKERLNIAGILYPHNLELLKQIDIYKYSKLWHLKNYVKEKNINFFSLTFYPIYYSQFEYLIRFGLYNLALTTPFKFTHQSFKDNFGIDKKYLPFMQEIDITLDELKILSLCPTADKEVLRFYSFDTQLADRLADYVKLDTLKKYFESLNLTLENIDEYSEYLRYCQELGLNIKDKNILYPKDFLESFDKLSNEYLLLRDPNIDERIKAIATISNINCYEDDTYIIFPASSTKSLIDESRKMHNCVRTYAKKVSDNNCQIYFMREKNNIDSSLVTIEVKESCIIEALMKYNESPPIKIKKVLEQWEKGLIPIYSE